MKLLSFLLLISLHSFAQVTPDGKPILNLRLYLLESGRVVEVPYKPSEPQYDISLPRDIPLPAPADSISSQRNVSEHQYNPPINMAGLEIYRNSISTMISSGKVEYNEYQLREQAEQARVARNVDRINRILPQMQAHLEAMTAQIENLDSRNYVTRSSDYLSQIKKIKQSDASPVKKKALINLYMVKLNQSHYDGEFGRKFDAVRAKYLAANERDFDNDAAYPFLDMGASSFRLSEQLHLEGQKENAEDSLELSNTFLDIALGATPFVGTFKDAWEAYTGNNMVTGASLDTAERTMAMVGFGAGLLTGGMFGGVAKVVLNTEKIGNLIRYGEKVLPIGKLVFEESKTLFKAALDVGLKTKNGIVQFVKVGNALKTLPAEYRILRIKEGISPDKIAIIGRQMKNGVDEVAEHFDLNGIKVKTFQWTDDAKREVDFLRRNYPDRRIPYEDVKKTFAYSQNKEWIEGRLKEGYTILDIGDPHLAEYYKEFSAFYDLEKELVFGVVR